VICSTDVLFLSVEVRLKRMSAATLRFRRRHAWHHKRPQTFLRTSLRHFRRKNKRKNRLDTVAVDFGAGLGARVHGRYPRGSRPWEERRDQHPDRCNSLSLLCYRTCSVSTKSVVSITRLTFSRGGEATPQAPEFTRRPESNVQWKRQRRPLLSWIGLSAFSSSPDSPRSQSLFFVMSSEVDTSLDLFVL
jgi:hypothetical protein